MNTKIEILEYLDNELHPVVSPENYHIYAHLHDAISSLDVRGSAHWIEDDDDEYLANCSHCGYQISTEYFRGYPEFCPYCGYRMNEEVNKESV